jgi:hypothetical protein
MAPFYSKLPLIASLRVKNDIENLKGVVKRGMFLSHLVYVLGFIFVGLFSGFLLKLIGSNVIFVSDFMWSLLGVAFFIHRFGAMHIQVYMSTNHIISHIADGVSGIIYIIVSLVLLKYLGLYAIPVGMICGYLGFYAWYAAMFSYRSLESTFWIFEKQVSFIPILIVLIYLLSFVFRTS